MNKSNEVPERKSIPDEFKWNLEAIYPSYEAWQESFNKIKIKIEELKNFSGTLGQGSGNLLAFIKENEAVLFELERLYVYASSKSHEDLRESKPMELSGLAENLLVKYSEAVAFFEPEVLALPQEYINDCLKNENDLALYKFFFKKLFVLENGFEPKKPLLAEKGDKGDEANAYLTPVDVTATGVWDFSKSDKIFIPADMNEILDIQNTYDGCCGVIITENKDLKLPVNSDFSIDFNY